MQTKNDKIAVKGKMVEVPSISIDDKKIIVSGKFIKTARLEEEWYEDVDDPASLVNKIRKNRFKADIFTFWQRLPDIERKYNYHLEFDPIAVVPITNFDYWWKKQINAKTRNVARKAEKKGVEIKIVDFDDKFVKGITSIFNETPARQGKFFWHYGKDFDTIKREFSRYIFREDMIGAYFKNELIGFIMLAYAGNYAILGQILSKIEHRDKSPTNALLAKAVEICADKEIPYLVYAKWEEGTLGAFKRHNGFEKIDLPRYYIPLNIKGKIAIKMKLHHGVAGMLPQELKNKLKDIRSKLYLSSIKEIS
jgi:hypothetical protein